MPREEEEDKVIQASQKLLGMHKGSFWVAFKGGIRSLELQKLR
jgi:hypothetical protein